MVVKFYKLTDVFSPNLPYIFPIIFFSISRSVMKLQPLLLICSILIYNVGISVYIFSNGFLIRRLALNDTNTQKFTDLQQFNKTIVLFVDALRFDFIFTHQNSLFGLPTIENLVRTNSSNAKLFKFIADPPTTTMQRIKALMSGTLPTFIGTRFV